MGCGSFNIFAGGRYNLKLIREFKSLLVLVQARQEWSHCLLVLVHADGAVSIFVKSLVEQSETLVRRIHILPLNEVTHIRERYVSLIVSVDYVEGHLSLDSHLVSHALSDQFDLDLALAELLEETLQSLPSLWLKVGLDVRLRAVKPTTRRDQGSILLLSRHESRSYIIVAPVPIRVPVHLVEDNEDLINRDVNFKVVLKCEEHVIAVDSSLVHLQLQEHLVNITQIEIGAQSKLSSLFLKVCLHYAHVAKGLSELFRFGEGRLFQARRLHGGVLGVSCRFVNLIFKSDFLRFGLIKVVGVV